MNRNKLILSHRLAGVLALLGSLLGSPAAVSADTIAYQNDASASPLQNWGLSLGMDFNVNRPILVTYLGAFDSGNVPNLIGSDGHSGVTIGIFDRTTGLPYSPLVTFTPSSPVVFLGGDTGDAFLPIAPLLLPAGFQGSIVAWNSINYNSQGSLTPGSVNPTSLLDSGGGAISFVGISRYDYVAGVYPGIPDYWYGGGPANRYDAGTFAFTTPVPGSLTLLGLGIVSFAAVSWRQRKAAVL